VFDHGANGQQLKCLTVTDEFSKEGLAICRIWYSISRTVSDDEAKVIIETWRRHYNEVRPHSSLGYLTPNEFVARLTNAASRHATGQGAAISGPSRPGPLRQPLHEEHMQQARDAASS
jgi:hypothetical protein